MNVLQRDKNIRNIEKNLTERALSLTDLGITDATERRNWRERIEEASNGRNTVIYNGENMPSVMVRVPSVQKEELDSQFSNGVHPAFVVNGNVKDSILIGKHLGFVYNKSGTDYALSLRGVDPATSIDYDESLNACANNGAGHHMMTRAEWAYIHLWSYLNDWEARGNTNNGQHHVRDDEKGTYARTNADRTITGSGPISWSHDGSPFGIFDMVGNIREWVAGFRLDEGEIQIIPDNNSADNSTDHSSASSEWQAILEDGSLVDPSTADTLKYDSTQPDDSGDVQLDTVLDNQLADGDDARNHFKDMVLASGVTVPEIAKLLQLYPHQTDIPQGYVYVRNYGERLPNVGGRWAYGSSAGLSYLHLHYSRSNSYSVIGFRPAYVNL